MQVPAHFEYQRATDVDHAVALLARYGPECRLVAGGHSLIPMMKLRLAQPEMLVDINELTELAGITVHDGELRIGALTRHAELLESPLVAEHVPMLVDAERVIADPVVRNRGTVGGSLCQADPSEDLSGAFTALRADGRDPRRVDGERDGAGAASSSPGPTTPPSVRAEILVEVRVPIRPRARQRLREGRPPGRGLGGGRRRRRGPAGRPGRSPRRASGSTAVGAPQFTRPGGRGLPARRRAGDPTCSPRPAGSRPPQCRPTADQRGPVDYKRHLAGELVTRALRARPPAPGGLSADHGERQRHRPRPRGRAPPAAGAPAARRAGADRHPLGLRHVELRGVRGLAGRGAGEVLHGARGDGRRAPGPHRGGPGVARRAGPVAALVHRVPRAAVRVLHAGDADDRPLAARPQPGPVRHRTIREAICGQTCRCTGYENIVRAVLHARPERGVG